MAAVSPPLQNRVLVVDDSITVRGVMGLELSRLGYQAVPYASAPEALAHLAREFVPLALVDWLMPEMSGLEFCQQVRKQQGGREYTILIVVTTLSEKERYLEAIDAGADDFLVKPVDVDVLKARLKVAERLRTLRMHLEHAGEFVTICMHCLKVRNEAQSWERVDTFVSRKTETGFSHGLCPECDAKYHQG